MSDLSEDQWKIATTLDDGFGNVWAKCDRADCQLQIVRPGKVQCSRCEEEADKDALLAEAAEVLREFSVVEPRDSDYGDCLHCQKVVGHEATCPWLRAKPLLGKLGERE